MTATLTLTEQLQQYSKGNLANADAAMRAVLPQLRAIAVRQLKRERYIVPLSPSELVDEVWISSIGKGGWQINDRNHFYAIMGKAMRNILIDFARARLAVRRGKGAATESLDAHAMYLTGEEPAPEQVIEVSRLLDQLELDRPDLALIVDLHHFAGFTLDETASITGLTHKQVRLCWQKAQNWIKDRMQ